MIQSDVARVRQQIASEYLAAQLGLSGLAEGTSRHSFITTKMERMGESFEALAEMMGKEQAIQIVAQTLQEVPEPLGLDFWIGLPEQHEGRVVPILPAPPPDPSDPISLMMATRKPSGIPVSVARWALPIHPPGCPLATR